MMFPQDNSKARIILSKNYSAPLSHAVKWTNLKSNKEESVKIRVHPWQIKAWNFSSHVSQLD